MGTRGFWAYVDEYTSSDCAFSIGGKSIADCCCNERDVVTGEKDKATDVGEEESSLTAGFSIGEEILDSEGWGP